MTKEGGEKKKAKINPNAAFPLETSKLTYQVGEVVAGLSCHETVREPKANHVLHVGVQAGRIGFEQHIDQAGQEVISISGLTAGHSERLKDVLTAFGYACKFVLRGSFGIHFNYGC